MKKQVITTSGLIALTAALLIFLYIYTASSKFLELQKFQFALSGSPLVEKNAPWLAWTIPAVEVIVSFFLFLLRYRTLGFLLSSALLTVFTLYIGYMIVFIPHIPCSCGGAISKLTWSQHLIFNLFFLAISVVGFQLSKRQQKFLLINRISRTPV